MAPYVPVAERRRREELERAWRMSQWRAARVDRLWLRALDGEGVLDTEGGRLLHRYMTATALRLMRAGKFEEADVLLELLPRLTANALLKSFFPEDFGDG
jgi:hypothetical protein